ncbi:MAG: sensor histidine kinase [Pirellulaceae bacterium]
MISGDPFDIGSNNWLSWAKHWIAPLVGGVFGVSLLAVLLSYRQADQISRRTTQAQFERIVAQCQSASFPLTSNVIQQIRVFSDTDIAIADADGVIQMTTLTIPQSSRIAIAPNPTGRFFSQEIVGVVYDLLVAKSAWRPGEMEPTQIAVLAPSSRRYENLRRLVLPQVGLAISSIIFVGCLAYLLIRRTARRLDRMQTQIHQIAAGEFLILDHPGPDDAFARFADAINVMSLQLKAAQQQISKAERLRLVHLMATGMAHQLRNTLTGATLLLQSHVREHSEQASQEIAMAIHQLEISLDSVRRLLASDSETEMVDDSILSVRAIHEQLHDAVGSLASHRGVTLKIAQNPADSPATLRHGREIVSALANLVINGIEAVAMGGEVSCLLERLPEESQGEVFHWKVIDTGAGPPNEIRDSIMETFVTGKVGGIGLGLPVAARVAERMGGSLWWERLEDRTVFHFRIQSDGRQRGEHG